MQTTHVRFGNLFVLLTIVTAYFFLFPPVTLAQTGDVPPEGSSSGDVYCPRLTSDLQYKRPRMTDATTGGQVSELQKFLESYFDDYPEGSVTGSFGPTTQSFVKRFQSENNLLPVAGYVGPKTRARIALVCGAGGGGGGSSSTPTATLTANGGASATVNATDVVNYKWSSTNGATAATTLTLDAPACGLTGTGPYAWSPGYADSLNGSNSAAPGSCLAGRTVTLTYKVTNAAGQSATAQAVVKVNATSGGGGGSTPTASITANGATTATVDSTATINYAWSSTNGATAASTYTLDAPACGLTSTGPFAWTTGFGDSLNGAKSAPAGTCLAGRTVTVTYKVTSSTGQSATAQLVVKVNAAGGGGSSTSTPTATITANGASSIAVDSTASINYAWSSTNGATAASTYTLDAPACGLTSTGPFAWTTGYGDSLSGAKSAPPGDCLAGRTITVTYKVTNSTGQSATSKVTVKVNATAGGGGGGSGGTGSSGIFDFGGMFSYDNAFYGAGGYTNPATGGSSCPSGYIEFNFQASYGGTGGQSDNRGSMCVQTHTASTNVFYDFGGMYGSGYMNGADITYPNPATGQMSCPAGYTASKVLGKDGVDYPLYFCHQVHTATSKVVYDFGGMFGIWRPYNSSFINPATGALSCPVGYGMHQVHGSIYNGVTVDSEVYFCAKPHTN